MTADEIRARIEQLENWIEWEKYADFMNWTEYYKAQHEIRELRKKLAEIEG